MNKKKVSIYLILIVVTTLYVTVGLKTYNEIEKLNEIQSVLQRVTESDYRVSVNSELLRYGISHSKSKQDLWIAELEQYNQVFELLFSRVKEHSLADSYHCEISQLQLIWKSTFAQIYKTKEHMTYFTYLPEGEALHSFLNNESSLIPRNERYALAQLNYELEAYDSFIKSVLSEQISSLSVEITSDITQRKQLLTILVLVIIPVFLAVIIALFIALTRSMRRTAMRTIQVKEMHKLEAIGRSTGQITHDFKNILAGIIGFSELGTTDSQCPELFQDYFKDIHQAAVRASELSSTITRLSGDTAYTFERIELKSVLSEVNRLVKVTLPSNISFLIHLPTKGLTISGNATQLYQVFMNLTINASHAVESKGEIKITARKKNSSAVLIDISDDGCGIPQESLKHIFDLGYTTKDNNGSGFGLSIVKDIIENHSGTISVKSTVGSGTTCTIELPLVDSL